VIAGIFDRRLQEALPAQAARVCCVGWDATHWQDLGLLDLAAAKAGAFEMYVPSPRLPADAQQREWIEALEQRLGLERVTCPESGFASVNEPLVARLEGSELASQAEVLAPGLLVGREWPDQVGSVCAQVLAWLAENPEPDAPIGVIAPEDSPTAVVVAEALEKAGVRVEHPERRRELGPALLIVEQVARYHLGGHDVAELLELTRLLWLHTRRHGMRWSRRRFRMRSTGLSRWPKAATRGSLPGRCRGGKMRSGRWCVHWWRRWDGGTRRTIRGPRCSRNGKTLLSGLRLPVEALRPPPRGLFNEERVSGRAFMEWVAEELAAERRATNTPDYAALAPVVMTTFANAAQQTWERLIFLESNEHIWPAPFGENIFLPDAARVRLNRTRKESGYLLTTRDSRALEQARFLDLIEHCRGSVALPAYCWSKRKPATTRNRMTGCSARFWKRGTSHRTSGQRAPG